MIINGFGFTLLRSVITQESLRQLLALNHEDSHLKTSLDLFLPAIQAVFFINPAFNFSKLQPL